MALAMVAGPAQAAGPAIPSPETGKPRTISVRGMGRAVAKPDTVVVMLGAEMRAPSVAQATADVAKRSTAFIERLKSMGVADRDIMTVAYSVDPILAQRRTEEDPTRIVAYRVLNLVRVKIRDVTAVGRILDAALTAGANTMSGLEFTLDNPSQAEAEARARAVSAAAATAQQLAAAAGVRLGELVSLSEEPRGGVRPMARLERVASAAVSVGPLESGEAEAVVVVEAQYRIGGP